MSSIRLCTDLVAYKKTFSFCCFSFSFLFGLFCGMVAKGTIIVFFTDKNSVHPGNNFMINVHPLMLRLREYENQRELLYHVCTSLPTWCTQYPDENRLLHVNVQNQNSYHTWTLYNQHQYFVIYWSRDTCWILYWMCETFMGCTEIYLFIYFSEIL